MDYSKHFKGKKITLMGLGLLGRAVGDARFFAQNGAELIVTDTKTEGELKSSVEKLKEFKNIKFKLGGHDLDDFRGRDLIIKGPLVPLHNIYIDEARKWQIPITMSTALFAKLSPAIIIGITGTKGKSTVTHLLYHILSSYSDRVFLGGNVKGVSTLEMLPDIKPADVVVLELDSWQLQGFGFEKISPHISVFTNFMEDHMNYYNHDMDLYFNDKANIFRFQRENDHLIIDDSLLSKVKEAKSKTHLTSSMWKFDIPEVESLPGDHNKKNIMFAMKAAELMGLDIEKIQEALKSFPGVPGRLQKIRTLNDVTYYNDNNATVPVATVAGIKALVNKGNVILISGGNSKDVSVTSLAETMNMYLKGAILIPGTGTDELLKEDLDIPIRQVETLEEAVAVAHKNSKPGDIVLFSPAFSSYNMFNNEYERGDLYDSLVEKLS